METKQVFKNKEWQDTFNRQGYLVLDLVDPEVLKEVNRKSVALLDSYKAKIPRRYFPIGQLMDYDLRNKSTELIHQYVLPHILKHFIDDSVDTFSGTHLVKPRGWDSFLAMHQDSSLVDETKYNAMIGWVPLTQINLLNGPLYVIEGSHLFGNWHRSTTFPWAFKGIEKETYKYAKRVHIKLGQVCYFHSGLIHYSTRNFIDKYRLAISTLIIDKGVPMLNYFADSNTPKDSVEIYEADMEFFHNNDFNKRPPVKYKRLEIVPRQLVDVDLPEFKRLVNLHNAQ